MTPAEQIAWHRSEADRIEAEERARRPALAAGQVWRIRSDDGDSWGYWTALPVDGGICLFDVHGACGWAGHRGFGSHEDHFEYVGLARDVLRVVPPEEWSDIRGAIQWSDSSAHWDERRKVLAAKFKAECLSPVPPDQPTVETKPVERELADDEVIEATDELAHPAFGGERRTHNWRDTFPDGITVAEARVQCGERLIRFFRKVQPDPPAPQVAPEPTGAELVGRKVWVSWARDRGWTLGGVKCVAFYEEYSAPYQIQREDGTTQFWCFAKPYVEGVAP